MQVEPAEVANKDDGDLDDSMSSQDNNEEVDNAKKALAEAPTFDAHLKLIQALRTAGDDFTGLRAARTAFRDAFPLPASAWMEWAEDELAMATGADARRFVVDEVLRRGTRDYLSIALWKRLLTLQTQRHRAGECEQKELFASMDELRASGALAHFTDGESLWNIMLKLMDSFGMDKTEALSEMRSLPLKLTDDSVERVQDVMDMVVSCDVFEEKLVEAGSNSQSETGLRDDSLKARFASYASFITEVSIPTARCIWERCVAECFLDSDVWLQYARFCQEKLSPNDERAVLLRASRNVPHELVIWRELIFNIERRARNGLLSKESASVDLLALLQNAHTHVYSSTDWNGAMRLSLAAMMCYRTLQLPKKVRDAAAYETVAYSEEGSTQWATCKLALAGVCLFESDTQGVVAHVHDVLGRKSSEIVWWIRCFELLRNGGADVEMIRSLFRRGLDALATHEDIEALGSAWVEYEMSSQTCCSYDEIWKLVEKRLSVLPQSNGNARHRTRETTRKPRVPTTEGEPVEETGKKRKTMEAGKKRRKVATKPKKSDDNEPKGNDKVISNGKANNSDSAPEKNDEFEANTVFIKNLNYKATDENVREKFGECGEIVGIRIPRRGDGAAKGIGYVEFASEEATTSALKLHDTVLLGRQIWVYRSKPPRRQPSNRGRGRERGRGVSSLRRGRGGRRRMAIEAAISAVDNGDGEDADASNTTDAEMTEAGDVSKTQDDFRSMLLDGK